jgi:beta-barrel assembly-enhancing protease
MKRWIAFAGTILALGAALVWSEIRKVEAPVGPEPILDFVADTEHELSRLPVKFAPLSDADEIKIGKELERRYAGDGRPDDDDQDRAIEEYVQQVGARVAANAHRKLPYRFRYIPGLDFVNAFALPGGPVFIGGGLMALMNTEDELAAVLGHELEHIDHYHCAERIQIQAALQQIPLGQLAALPVEVFIAGYSKNQELEADREGAKLAVAALYSPQGAIRMFQAMERFRPANTAHGSTPAEELSQVALETLEGYFRSHPRNAERIDQIQKMIAGGQLPDWRNTKPMAFAYFFLTERAWRLLAAANVRPTALLNYKEKRKREEERTKQFQEAMQLASQSLVLHPDGSRGLEIMAVAHLGLGEYDAAKTSYRGIVTNAPTFADGVRKYADSMAREALRIELYQQAKELAVTSLEMQPNRPEALEILAEAQLRLSDLRGAAESGGKLREVDSAAATAVSVYASRLASVSLFKNQYQEAVSLAELSLELDAYEWDSVATLAKARFALADFAEAAKAYRKLLDRDPSDMRVVRRYADALSAAGQVSEEFGEWRVKVHFDDLAFAMQVRVEQAGLKLMSADDREARSLVLENPGLAPEFLGRLGWWYYRAGNYSTSSELLLRTVAMRPGNLSLHAALAFDQLEQHQLVDAIRHFSVAIADNDWNSPQMGRAVARWQARQTDEALEDYEAVAKGQPEWRNPRWVKALYSPAVAQGVAEMEAERDKRPIVKSR